MRKGLVNLVDIIKFGDDFQTIVISIFFQDFFI